MPSTIVDRILAEYKNRKSSREAILREKAKSILEQEDVGPRGEEILRKFENELAPVISRVISAEISGALEKASQVLLKSLEQGLSRIAPPIPPKSRPAAQQAPPAEEMGMDTIDTDLDLPAEEVNRQLDLVFGITKFPQENPSISHSKPSKKIQEPSAPAGIGFTDDPQEENNLEPPTVNLSAAVLDSLTSDTEDISLEPSRENDVSPMGGHSNPETSEVIPASLSEIPQPVLFDHVEGPGSLPPEEELPEALIPDITDEVTRIVDEIERGQKRISGEMSSLAERVADLEAKAFKKREGTGEVPPEEPDQNVDSSPIPVPRNQREEENDLCDRKAPKSPSPPFSKRSRKTTGRAAILELEETFLQFLQGMEKRILERLDSLQERHVEQPKTGKRQFR